MENGTKSKEVCRSLITKGLVSDVKRFECYLRVNNFKKRFPEKSLKIFHRRATYSEFHLRKIILPGG